LSRPESGRKVIKATITIPLPKADMGVIICKPRKKKGKVDDEEDLQMEDDSDVDIGTDENDEDFIFTDPEQ
jgi:hypothetical protein